jgi:histidyl-tRNA synthetase
MNDKIEPRVLKGFRDILPPAEMERRRFISIVEAVFRSFGFVPIDTPSLEYSDILFGKGGGETEKQVYRFTDNGGRDIALRFDLTVPFARFMAEHVNELPLPFKRYHISKVWRGENTQRGRYREFYQCDFDCVGADCAMADFEILSIMVASLKSLGLSSFTIRLSHRGIFNRFLAHSGISGQSVEILRLVDKLRKIGADEVKSQLAGLIGGENAERVLDFIHPEVDFEKTIEKMERLAGGEAEDGHRLRTVRRLMIEAGLEKHFVLDPSITRGLDYYTGVVFETFLDELPAIGSVCSGGRYDDLASLYTNQKLPGVGASIGMDRLLAALESLGASDAGAGSSDVLIVNAQDAESGIPFKLAQAFRLAGLSCEVYTDRKKAGPQFAYAEKKAIPFAITDLGDGRVCVKDIKTRQSQDFDSLEGAVAHIKAACKGNA